MATLKIYSKPKLKKLREQHGSMQDIVDMLAIAFPDMTVSTYQKYENSSRPVPLRLALSLCDIFEVKPVDLFKIQNKNIDFGTSIASTEADKIRDVADFAKSE